MVSARHDCNRRINSSSATLRKKPWPGHGLKEVCQLFEVRGLELKRVCVSTRYDAPSRLTWHSRFQARVREMAAGAQIPHCKIHCQPSCQDSSGRVGGSAQ